MQRYTVIVKPKSSQEKVQVDTPTFLTVWVRERPEDGEANQKVRVLLAAHFHISAKLVKIISGHRATIKIIEVADE